jgi:dephospho-CoA kinase
MSVRLGLTGGIGSGKSTVAAILKTFGAFLIDADEISRATTASGGSAMPAIQATFGSAVLTPDNSLDREKMRALIYCDAGAKHKLEAIIHPLVGQTIEQQAELAQASGYHCTVFDIPLLVESTHWRANLDRILVVDCTVATQISRVSQRSGLRTEDIEKIIANQAAREQRCGAADFVIYNDGISLNTLTLQLREIAPRFGL